MKLVFAPKGFRPIKRSIIQENFNFLSFLFLCQVLGEPKVYFFCQTWDFVPTGLTPLPPHRRLGHPHQKKNFWCLFCILGYSKHFIFSWKFSFFLVGIGWDWGILGSNSLVFNPVSTLEQLWLQLNPNFPSIYLWTLMINVCNLCTTVFSRTLL